ncbi:Ankyrin repeat family protein, putative isoform 1 [Theobroma cacao]|uniref:Ankyrin repeat family protein, putative isoform 1 n=1 Tax=Theobroma cacao TaxID=3641 RepID=A0A061G174_THECC|nr:Ankyrin repeat family protein, putative isoform 1 [Theobroma cacao]
MEANSVCSSAIVAQVLTGKDDYENWRACIKNYLWTRDLWDVVEQTSEDGDWSWRMRNVSALHAIQISCDPTMLSKIRDKTTAKDAWSTLAKECGFQNENDAEEDGNVQRKSTLEFLEAIKRCDLERTKILSRADRLSANTEVRAMGNLSVFDFAIFEGQLEVIDEFVSEMAEENLGTKNHHGNTVLHYVALCSANTEIAQRLITKDKELLPIQNCEGDIPLNFACLAGHKDMTQYLYSMTTPRFLIEEENKRQAVLVVRHCIRNKLFDVALDLLLECPQLAFAEVDGMNAVSVLSSQPSAFPSGNRLSFWQRWIYSCLKLMKKLESQIVIFPYFLSSNLQRNNYSLKLLKVYILYIGLSKSENGLNCAVTRHTLGLWSNLLKFFGMKHIYDLKQAHVHAHVLLLLMSEEIAKLDFAKVHENSVHQAIMNAAQRGMTEFIVEIIKRNLDLLVTKDVDDRDMFKIAVAHRQEKVFNLIYGLDTKKQLFLPFVDKLDNSMFHVAGKLSSESQVKLEQISGSALQMQRELQWFKEVESIIPPMYKEYRNKRGETPYEAFDQSHAKLVKEGEKWMKDRAQSSSVVGTLIITIMFAALFTVPGGPNQETGVPILLRKKHFRVFVISDAISLSASTTSMLIFVGILTSRYTAHDFLISLPNKLIIRLSFLFISIAAMMVAFSSTVFIMLKGQLEIIIPIVVLVGFPIGLFVWLQFPLLAKIFISTYGPGIFDKKMKKWL